MTADKAIHIQIYVTVIHELHGLYAIFVNAPSGFSFEAPKRIIPPTKSATIPYISILNILLLYIFFISAILKKIHAIISTKVYTKKLTGKIINQIKGLATSNNHIGSTKLYILFFISTPSYANNYTI